MTSNSFFGISSTAPLPSFTCIVALLLLWTAIIPSAHGWKHCQGGGVCPDYATCCPSSTPGSPPACISTRHGKDPLNATGICCDETTGCPYGFSCGVHRTITERAITASDESGARDDKSKEDDHIFRKRNGEEDEHQPYCKIDAENPPVDLFHDQPRYQMCRIPDPSMTILHGFPIGTSKRSKWSSAASYSDAHQLAYYSSHGDLQQWSNDESSSSTMANKKGIEKVLIMIHGSGRTAEDYFCVALSLVPEAERENVLVIAPKFLAPVDINTTTTTSNQHTFLVWQNDEDPPKYPMAHSWRYGADALNAPVSSYAAIDRLVEYLISSSANGGNDRLFPNLKQISIAGHSAGGQVVHRWGLLSKIPQIAAAIDVEIRVVAANPRSYCYLDGKRMMFHNATNTTRWEYPPAREMEACSDYNQWNWGLEDGGALDPVVPYFVRRIKETSLAELAMQYASRKVFYLTGEYDVIEQNDHCATYELQGANRHERALHYFAALKAYFQEHDGESEQLNHDLHTIPESPHDHVLMFQSDAGRQAIFGGCVSETSPPSKNDSSVVHTFEAETAAHVWSAK